MMESFLGGRVTLHCGDNRDVLRDMPDCSVDSIVTDPPYALVSITKRFGTDGAAAVKVPENGTGAYARASAGFMGQKWDTGDTVHAVEFWAECLRVLKPGGHLAAFSGTRTYHKMATAIELAGFEVRDMVSWNFGSGFPKSHDISKKLDATKERCSCPSHLRSVRCDMDSKDALSSDKEQDMQSDLPEGITVKNHDRSAVSSQSEGDSELRCVREADHPSGIASESSIEASLLKAVQRHVSGTGVGQAWPQGSGGPKDIHADVRAEQSGLEGRSDIPETSRKLREREICEMSSRPYLDVQEGRLCDGASPCNGENNRASSDSSGVRPPYRSHASEQQPNEFGTMAGQPQSQTGGAWENCGRCGKPIIPDGLGTALKPAHEPICMARKPLSEGTVASNVLKHGTGAINVDGCRVESGESRSSTGGMAGKSNPILGKFNGPKAEEITTEIGRWPANLIHDGSEEVIAAFPESDGQLAAVSGREPSSKTNGVYGQFNGRPATEPRNDSGSAARFFYTAKADSDDRIGSKHPTVKPVDLMQWLVRLVTPKGGLVLDPFAGTGTTAEACFREGMSCILIERETAYQADIRRRMALVMAGPDERARESIKARTAGQPIDLGPLFQSISSM